MSEARELGHFFKNLVLQHLRVLCALMTPRASIFHWRTTGKHEVDFVVERGQQLLAIEVKLTEQPQYVDSQGLERFLALNEQATCGLLVHTGKNVEQLGDRIFGIPWSSLAID